MCKIQVGHPSYHHWWSPGYADQIKVVPPKERKRKVPSPPILEVEKHPRMAIALLEKKIEDLSDVIYTLEQRIDEEHVYRKSLQHDLNALNHFVAKMRKWELGSW